MAKHSTDMTDKQWAKVQPLLKKENRDKHFDKHSKRELINAALYLDKTGCQWRLLPNDFPSLHGRLVILPSRTRKKAGGRRPCLQSKHIECYLIRTMVENSRTNLRLGK